MYTLNREMIEELNRWEELGLHIEFDVNINRGVTEEDLADFYNTIDNQGEE